VRLGAGYEFNKKFSIFGGAYWSSHFNPELDWENRLWEQATYTSQIGKLTLQNRLRLEQLQRAQYEGRSWRIRHQIRITYPISSSRNWYLIATEEPFFNLNAPENGPHPGFNQNRLFFGVGRRVNTCTRMEIGYLHQYKNNTDKPDLVNRVLLIQLSFDLTGLKKTKSMKLAAAPGTTSIQRADPLPPIVHVAKASSP